MFAVLFGFLLLQRLCELVLAERNRRWAMQQGGRETGQGHYPLLVGLHVLFYASLSLEYAFLSRAWNRFWPVWLLIFILAQSLRVWAIASLGRLWNTRIIVVPELKPVAKGPYRFIRHPNYAVVAVEVFVIPVMCGAYFTAILFSVLNAILISIRIREEEHALQEAGGINLSELPRFIPRYGRKRT